ncbi:MAG: sulfite exporter TauE/SafE family protein [Actinomycetota bacterium]|nr:sulfite exporter TauE/SafE family protein [Actinomycetota bacterium]
MTVLAAGLGLPIGVVMGGLGGGGAVLTVPALVYLLGLDAQAATTSSLAIVGLTAAVGAVDHARMHGLRWRTGLAFGVVGIGAAFAGTRLNRLVEEQVLLLGFAALMVVFAVAMLIGEPVGAPNASTAVGRVRTVVLIVLAGSGVGFLTGLFGVGGGFMIIPALVLVLHVPMVAAVGTSLLVIAVNSGTSLAFHAGDAQIDWTLTAPFAMTAVVGALAGSRVADRLPSAVLTRAFAVLLLAVAVLVAVENLQ